MKLFALLFAAGTSLSAMATTALSANKSVMNFAEGEWTLKFVKSGNGFRETEEAIQYKSHLTELTSGISLPDTSYAYHRQVKAKGAPIILFIKDILKSNSSITVVMPRWDNEVPRVEVPVIKVEKIKTDKMRFTLSGKGLTLNNKELRSPEPGIDLSAEFKDAICDLSADELSVICRMPMKLEARCLNFLNCHF